MVHPHEVYSKLEPWTIRIINLAKEFIRVGHQVKIVYFSLGLNKNTTSYLKEGIEFIPFLRDESPLALFENCIRLSKIIGWGDMVHFQKCFHYAALPVLLNCCLKNKPVHYDWDDWEEKIYYDSAVLPNKLVALFLRILERSIPKVVDTISVSSQRLKNLCLDLGIENKRIFDAHVGADLERFKPEISGERVKREYRLNKPTVLYLGQLHGAQYAELFIRAAEILIKRETEISFIIVGGGFRYPRLKEMVDSLGLSRDVFFTGAVEHEQVPEYIAACDIAVACFEDNDITRCKSPLKIAEYLACGKPIVASAVGEVTGMVNGCGILTKPGDPLSLAEGILNLLKNKELRIQMGLRARRLAEEKYNWALTAKNISKAYELAIKTA